MDGMGWYIFQKGTDGTVGAQRLKQKLPKSKPVIVNQYFIIDTPSGTSNEFQ